MFKIKIEEGPHLLYSLTNHTSGFNQYFLWLYLQDLQ